MALRIGLIHATPLAMAPINAALKAALPQAQPMNVLDDSLSADRAAPGGMQIDFAPRFRLLTDYCLGQRCDAIIYTCSAFGEAIEAVRAQAKVPMLKPNEAMIEEALAAARPIVVMATFAPSIPSIEVDFREALGAAGRMPELIGVHVPDAQRIYGEGDAATHDRLIVEAAVKNKGRGLLMLSQFSMARAAAAVEAATGQRPLTSPESAVRKLKGLLGLH
jgi:Asp/Glu/hydantoin racemase